MSVWKKVWRRYGINPLNSLLKKAQREGKTRFLICWNRGLGDIPLGLYALTQKIFTFIPDASITFLTRPDLKEGFDLLPSVDVRVCPSWKRGEPISIPSELKGLFDVVLEKPDPTAWLLKEQKHTIPKLMWNSAWDKEVEGFNLDPQKTYIAVHTETQTVYGYEKNWPCAHFEALFSHLPQEFSVILVGGPSSVQYPNTIDLRGKTSLKQLLALIKNHTSYLLAPDSGILSMVYYLDACFPLKVVSLWADPRQGILKHKIPSPNPKLTHFPLIADKLEKLDWQTVLKAFI
ncbi:MAG: hypothetical protein RLZZ453_513 [Chlamydiota bacterium]|jgi:ADP-heptose:LPS heptosyltransferase